LAVGGRHPWEVPRAGEKTHPELDAGPNECGYDVDGVDVEVGVAILGHEKEVLIWLIAWLDEFRQSERSGE
jgi:hypothetical protein